MPNIGLVLSGGFAKGAYQIGVLKALKQFLPPNEFTYISASSIGALNAYCFVQNKLEEAENIWRNQKFAGLRSFTHAYARSEYVPNSIREITKVFSPYKPELYTTLLNISTRSLNYVNLKEIDPGIIWGYLQASVSLPMVSKIVDIGGTKYCDGAFVDNIPTEPLLNKPLDYAIVVHFDQNHYTFENDYFDKKLIKINFLEDKIIGNSLAFDEDSIAYMIQTGYDKSMTLFDMYFKNGVEDIDYIYSKIRFIDELRGKQPFRLTGDVVVNNLNKILKKVVKSKV
ncbi:MAG: patatin-like phospholipase family protein [Oscillospiraceae bacterium]|nr:patatin-like phospholipase family protein [Oscillospiraceae bacterium]